MSILSSTQSGKHRPLTLDYLLRVKGWQNDITGFMNGEPVGKVGPGLFLRPDLISQPSPEDFLIYQGDTFRLPVEVPHTDVTMYFHVENLKHLDLVEEYFAAKSKKECEDSIWRMSLYMQSHVLKNGQTSISFPI